MLLAPIALLLLSQPIGAAQDSELVDMGNPLRGADFLLIAEAARHPAMRGMNLACYQIHVYDQGGRRRVVFLAPSRPDIVTERGDDTVIEIVPPDPACRTISFEMDESGRVTRVIRTRH